MREEKNLLRKKVEDLLRRGEIIGRDEIHVRGKALRDTIGGTMYDSWMGEINIFNDRHLKGHPLHHSIYSTYCLRRNKDSYDDMMGHLRALSADEEFLGPLEEMGEGRKMENYSISQMLVEDIRRCKMFLDNPTNESVGREIYEDITGRYDSIIPDFGKGLYQYYEDQHFYDPEISGDSLIFNVKQLMNKMKVYLALNSPAINRVEARSNSIQSVNKGDKQMSHKVFVVHGHDNEAKQEMARALEKAGFEAIILHEQPDGGRTIIEKFEKYTDVSFAVVLYTECDKGRAKGESFEDEKSRARQNVVFEHGYLIGKLGRGNVCALVKGDVETPGDISGVVYIPMDPRGAWKIQLFKNMKDVGIDVDLNTLC